jgi:hypothetical protein
VLADGGGEESGAFVLELHVWLHHHLRRVYVPCVRRTSVRTIARKLAAALMPHMTPCRARIGRKAPLLIAALISGESPASTATSPTHASDARRYRGCIGRFTIRPVFLRHADHDRHRPAHQTAVIAALRCRQCIDPAVADDRLAVKATCLA